MSFNIDTHIAMHCRSRRTERKKGLQVQAERITLWACSCSSWQAMVTSKNSFSSLMSLNTKLIFLSKSFQERQNFSELAIVAVFLGLYLNLIHILMQIGGGGGLKSLQHVSALLQGQYVYVYMLKHPAFNYLSLFYCFITLSM